MTGRESYNDGGAGKYVSQGAADIVQSALFKSGVTIVNRRSMGIPQTEARWGLRDIKGQMPVNFSKSTIHVFAEVACASSEEQKLRNKKSTTMPKALKACWQNTKAYFVKSTV